MRRGELLGGVYGEGYVDRRHPHTLVHEAMVARARRAVRGGTVSASLAAGKGFVPFGTDDPMMRPFERYPVNHHLAQILERVVAIGAVRVPHAAARRARSSTAMSRTGAVRARRATIGSATRGPRGSRCVRWIAAPPSGARPASSCRSAPRASSPPRTRTAAGSISGSGAPRCGGRGGTPSGGAARPNDRASYAARRDGRAPTGCAAAGASRSPATATAACSPRRACGGAASSSSARAERTDRLEEERDVDPFRTVRPHSDVATLGVTRLAGAHARRRAAARRVGGGDAARWRRSSKARSLAPRAVVPGAVFDPVSFYGGRRLWSLTAGVRLGAGMRHARMGRYGVRGAVRLTPLVTTLLSE